MIPVGAVVVFASYMMWFYNYSVSPAVQSSSSSSSEQQQEEEGVRWILCFYRRPLSQHTQSSSARAIDASNHHDSKQPLSAELKNNAAALQSIIVHVVEPDGSSCVATNDTACSV
jgi:hypothetical protein